MLDKKIFLYKRVMIGVMILFLYSLISIYSITLLTETERNHEYAALTGLFLVSFLIIWFLAKYVFGRFHLLEPQVTGGLMLILLFGVRPFVMVLAGDTNFYRWLYIGSTFDAAVLLGVIGTVVFVVTYEIGNLCKKKSDCMSLNASGQESGNMFIVNLYVAVLAALSIVLFLFQLHLYGGVFYSLRMFMTGHTDLLAQGAVARSEYLSISPILSSCAATLLILVNKGLLLSRKNIIYILVLIAFPAVVFMLSGERRFLIPSVGIPLVAYYLITYKKFPLKALMLLLPIASIALVSAPYLRQTEGREAMGGLDGYLELIATNPSDLAKTIFLRGDTEMVAVLAAEMNHLHATGDYYLGGASIGDLFIAPIPGAVFPNKPMSARDHMLVQLFDSPCIASYGGICPDFSALGTFYQDAGWYGTLFGMAVIGFMSGSLWRKYRLLRGGLLTTGILSCWIILLPIMLRAGFMPGFAWFLYFALPISMGLVLFQIKRTT